MQRKARRCRHRWRTVGDLLARDQAQTASPVVAYVQGNQIRGSES